MGCRLVRLVGRSQLLLQELAHVTIDIVDMVEDHVAVFVYYRKGRECLQVVWKVARDPELIGTPFTLIYR